MGAAAAPAPDWPPFGLSAGASCSPVTCLAPASPPFLLQGDWMCGGTLQRHWSPAAHPTASDLVRQVCWGPACHWAATGAVRQAEGRTSEAGAAAAPLIALCTEGGRRMRRQVRAAAYRRARRERKGRALTGREEPRAAAQPGRTRAASRAGQVGEGAALAEGELVMPLRPHMGTWRSLAVWRARDLLRLPPDALPARGPAVLPASACGPHACGAIGSNGPNVYLYMSSECFSAPRNGRSKACFSQLGLLRQRVCQASKHSWHSCHMLVTYV